MLSNLQLVCLEREAKIRMHFVTYWKEKGDSRKYIVMSQNHPEILDPIREHGFRKEMKRQERGTKPLHQNGIISSNLEGSVYH